MNRAVSLSRCPAPVSIYGRRVCEDYPIRAAAASRRSLMTRPEPSQSAVRLMSQAGPGPGFGFVDLEHAMLVRAPQLHVQRLAALAVPDHHGPSVGAGFPSVAPLHQYDQGREQVMAFFGEQVLMAFTLAGFAIRLAVQHAVLDERGESLTEQGPRTADVGEVLLEAARTVKRLAQHQQRPLLPDDVEGALDRAVAHSQFLKAGRPGLLDVNQSPAHGPMLAEFDNATQALLL